MPPKTKITRDQLVDAAFSIARAQGAEKITARTVAQYLNCSTQPVLYHFPRMDSLRAAACQRADAFHTAYITAAGAGGILAVGLRYIQFAAEEFRLFRFLFQSDGFAGQKMSALFEDPALDPVLALLERQTGTERPQTRKIFSGLFLFVHGYASMLANNRMEFDEEAAVAALERAYIGAVYAAKEEI